MGQTLCIFLLLPLWFKIEKKRTFTLILAIFQISTPGGFFLVGDIKVDLSAKFQVIWCCFRGSRAVWSWKMMKNLIFSDDLWAGNSLQWLKILKNGFQFLIVLYIGFILIPSKIYNFAVLAPLCYNMYEIFRKITFNQVATTLNRLKILIIIKQYIVPIMPQID